MISFLMCCRIGLLNLVNELDDVDHLLVRLTARLFAWIVAIVVAATFVAGVAATVVIAFVAGVTTTKSSALTSLYASSSKSDYSPLSFESQASLTSHQRRFSYMDD